MSMVIDNERNILRFDVPNSEANINAQHSGIKDRTVGSYYMSDNYALCSTFLADFRGEYFIDIPLCIRNGKAILDLLKQKGYQKAFKSELAPQFNVLEALNWSLNNGGDFFYKINPPSVNDQQKYLKLDNEDDIVNLFKTLILGDLVSIYIQKVGNTGFLIYLDKNPKFDALISSNEILKWMR